MIIFTKSYIHMTKKYLGGQSQMKDLDYCLTLPYKLEIIPNTEDSGFVARYPKLPGGITCSDTIEAVTTNAIDAKKRG